MPGVRLLEHPLQGRRETVPWLPITLVAGVGLIVGSVTWLMEHGSYGSFAAILVALALIAISTPLLRRASRFEADPRVARLLWIAFCCKLLAALPRYVVTFGLYDGKADATAYSTVGAALARQFRQGDFAIDIGRRVQGTGFIQIVTGAVYTVTGATDLGGFLVFSWLSFWGLYLFHRAFVRACPAGDHLRYAQLVFFLPSLLFWPSSIGKEAWMCFALGLCAYGAALVLTAAHRGVLVVSVGLVCLGMVRPHVAAILAASLFTAYVLRRSPRSESGLAPFAKLIGILVLGGILVLAVGELQSFLGVDAFDQESVQLSLNEVTQQTGQGGSYIRGTHTNLSPSHLPQAFVNVVFRPFIWQANNMQSLLAAAEATLLIVLVLAGWRRLVSAARAVLDTPYVILCSCYTVLFVYGFSSFANYGILVRQRVQVLPFLLAVLAMPPHRGGKTAPMDLRGASASPPA